MNRMKEVRLIRGIKQKDIVEATGLSKASISTYETGRCKPSMNNAFKIAQVLGSTVDELFNSNHEINESKKGGVTYRPRN